MEASEAGLAAEAQVQGEGGQEGQEAQAPSLDPQVMERINQLADTVPQIQETVQGLNERFESFGQEQEPDEQSGFLYDEWGNPVDPQTGQPVDEQQVLQQELEKRVEEKTQPLIDAVNRLIESQEQQRVIQEADALEEEFPQIQDPEYAGKLVEQARDLASSMGQPELANEPKFIRLAHLAGIAEQLAAGETPAGSTPEAVQIEGGGFASPGGEVEDDTGMRIVNAGRGNGSVLGGLR